MQLQYTCHVCFSYLVSYMESLLVFGDHLCVLTVPNRRLILASGIEGIEGFRQRWSLHGRLTDTK